MRRCRSAHDQRSLKRTYDRCDSLCAFYVASSNKRSKYCVVISPTIIGHHQFKSTSRRPSLLACSSHFSRCCQEVSMKRALLAALSFAAAHLLSVATAPDALAQIDANPIVRNAAYASLTEETPNNPYGARLSGTVNWRLESEVSEPRSDSPTQVSIEIEIPARGLSASLTIRPNRDPAASVSHFLETKFYVPRDFQHGGISSVRGILMKPSEHVAGTPLQGYITKLLPNVFTLGL